LIISAICSLWQRIGNGNAIFEHPNARSANPDGRAAELHSAELE
jgi:hypothetical protein